MRSTSILSIYTIGALLFAATGAVSLVGSVFAEERETVVAGSIESAAPGEKIAFEATGAPFLSDGWRADFAVPPRSFRPLQIVHGRDLTDPKTVEYYRDDCGLGGLVVNVGGAGYVREQANWDRFVAGLRNLKNAGMRAWIYDEDGYPSLSAGGVVLEGDRSDLWSLELAFDPEREPPYYVRDSYEYTHASNNYCAARRYPNPLDPAATERFLDVTHRRYRAELSDDLFNYVEAFFTDEPSMQAVNLGEIQEDVRVRVPTVDKLDPSKKATPVVPWCDDLEERYREKYGEELAPNFKSLFEGDSDADRAVRKRFWSLVGELDVERFYRPIQRFCRESGGPVASGHTLCEENIVLHVPLDGNKMAALKTFDLPGLDMLNSDPNAYFWGCWLAAAFPCSAAEFVGQRKVMTEISDFSQLNSGDRKAVDLPTMEAAAAWQAAFGVTEFALYYGINGGDAAPYRDEGTHRDYCRYVGRLNAVLRDATPVRPVLLYYPIDELQEEYRPSAKKIDMNDQTPRARALWASFNLLGETLSRRQIPFCVADRATLRNLTKTPDDPDEAARIANRFSGVLFPRCSEKVEFDWANPDFGEVWADDATEKTDWTQCGDELEGVFPFAGPRLTPTDLNPNLIEGTFERDGRLVFLVSNPLKEDWAGTLRLDGRVVDSASFVSDAWTLLDPKTGAIETFVPNAGEFSATLPARASLVFVSPARK